MENKNTIIALVLMLVVWFGFSFLFPPQEPEITAPKEQVSESAPSVVNEPAVVSKPVEPLHAPAAEAGVNLVQNASRAEDVVVETPLFTAVFTNAGAKLKSFELANFRVSAARDSAPVALTVDGPSHLGNIRTTGTDGLAIPSDALYRIGAAERSLLLEGSETRTVVFTLLRDDGLRVEKSYTFYGDSYKFDLEVRVINGGSSAVRGNLEVSLVQPWDDSKAGDSQTYVGPATLVGDGVETDDPKDLLEEGPKLYSQDTVWSAFENKYFMSAIVPQEGAAEKIRIERTGDAIVNAAFTPYRTLQAGESAAFNYLLYFGPRDPDILNTVHPQLAQAVDFGIFAIIAKPLLHTLKFFNSFIGNFGVAIIILTVIIKLLFWPLTQKSYSSMKEMQKLQPEMAKIREKFKNDRERLNREIMELYKTHRVNPLGGCLPMLIQIPVFFALYKVLLETIELRQAPFALWLTDLSAKDPYYITPLIMGATMFIQQKMTPTTMDPNQAKLFMLMPVIFTFLFLNFPSGLVLYWLVNNLLTILQQYFIHKKA